MMILIILKTLFFIEILSTKQDLLSFTKKMEQKLITIAQTMLKKYEQRCNSQVTSCVDKSYNFCIGIPPKQCIQDFPLSPNCYSSGAYLANYTSVRVHTSNQSDLIQQQKRFICSSTWLKQEFINFGNNNANQYASIFVGSYSGAIIRYPSNGQNYQNGTCKVFDPRLRPWYVLATSGSKNIIMLIDVSVTMADLNRMDMAKQILLNILTLSSFNDYVAIIKFGTNAQSINGSPILLNLGEDTMTKLKSSIQKLLAGGNNNYTQGFERAFNMLDATTNLPCPNEQTIIVILTDGAPKSSQNLSTLKQFIDSKKGNRSIAIFTFSFQAQVTNLQIPNGLACAYNGISFKVNDTISPTKFIQIYKQFTVYLSEGNNIKSPIWTEPYQDHFGFGRMVTVAMPIFYTENNIKKILGAAGLDIVMDQIIKFGLNQSQSMKAIKKVTNCSKSTLTDCQIQQLRGINNCLLNCTFQNAVDSCNQMINKSATDIFYIGKDPAGNLLTLDTYLCCGLTRQRVIGTIIGSIVGFIVFIAIIVFIIVYLLCCRERQDNKDNQNKGNIVPQTSDKDKQNEISKQKIIKNEGQQFRQKKSVSSQSRILQDLPPQRHF